MVKLNSVAFETNEQFLKYSAIAVWTALCVHLVFFAFFYFQDVIEMLAFNLLSILIYSYSLYLLKLKKYELILKIAYAEIIFHSLLATYYVGIESGFYYYLFVLAIISLILKHKSIRSHIIKSLFILGLFFIIELVFSKITPVYAIDEDVLLVVRLMNLFALLISSIPFMYYFIYIDLKTEKLLYSYATKDQLTGLYNRRYIDSIVEYEYSKRDMADLVVVLADIDYFKKINDNYGHHCGDEVLVEVSKTLQKCIRKGDTLSRWGGEEFLFFLPSANIEDAKVLIKRVQKEVDSLYFTCGEVKGIKVTMTFGVAQRDENEKFDDILSRADIALYDGKMAGRDCVVVSEAKV